MANRNKGRQKIEMKKMSKKSNLLVTFSKRRAGLFTKASELCTLCRVEMAIVVFSPGEKAYSFGHPSVEAVVEKFFQRTSVNVPSGATSQLPEAYIECVNNLNVLLTKTMSELELENKRGEELNKLKKKPDEVKGWWESPIAELEMDQLQQLKLGMEELKKNVEEQAEKLRTMESSNIQHPYSYDTSLYGAGTSTSGNASTSNNVKASGNKYGVDYKYDNGPEFGQGNGHEYFG